MIANNIFNINLNLIYSRVQIGLMICCLEIEAWQAYKSYFQVFPEQIFKKLELDERMSSFDNLDKI